MNRPLPGKNEGKGKSLDFRTLVVQKDEDDVFMSTRGELPTLLSSIYVAMEMLTSLTYS